jgi:outer membrane protein assembly factor BamB
MKILLNIFFIFSLYAPVIKAQEIAQWRGPERNGIYNEVGLLKKWPDKGPRLLWHFDELGAGHTSASVTKRGVYTTGMTDGTGYVYAFDLNGKLLWKKEYGQEWARNYDGTRSTPLVIDEKLYLMSAYGKLLCMSGINGQTIWSVDLVKEYGARSIEWGMTENLISDGNVLYCTPGGSETSIVALDRNSGKLIWKAKGIGEKSAYCSPIMIKIADRKILVTLMEKSVCGFNPVSGLLLWKFEHANTYNVHPNSPVYFDGHLFCFSENGKGGLMLKLENGGKSVTELWSSTLIDNITSGAVILNGRIYGTGDRNRKLFCLDMKTGKELFSLANVAPANIIANEGLLYLYSESGKIFLIEAQAERFNIISSFPVPYGSNPHWAHLVLKDRKLYVRHGKSIMVYDVAAV